jgi:rhodanese-related sulfurtransferase
VSELPPPGYAPSVKGYRTNGRRTALKTPLFFVGLLALAAAGLLSACGGDTATQASSPASSPAAASQAYADISPSELAAMLKNKDFLLINTHVPYEGEIEQTDLFLPYDQAAELSDQLPRNKDAKIVVYCRSDRMSRIAADVWAQEGYTNLYNLEGGFTAWEQAGYPLLQKAQ